MASAVGVVDYSPNSSVRVDVYRELTDAVEQAMMAIPESAKRRAAGRVPGYYAALASGTVRPAHMTFGHGGMRGGGVCQENPWVGYLINASLIGGIVAGAGFTGFGIGVLIGKFITAYGLGPAISAATTAIGHIASVSAAESVSILSSCAGSAGTVAVGVGKMSAAAASGAYSVGSAAAGPVCMIAPVYLAGRYGVEGKAAEDFKKAKAALEARYAELTTGAGAFTRGKTKTAEALESQLKALAATKDSFVSGADAGLDKGIALWDTVVDKICKAIDRARGRPEVLQVEVEGIIRTNLQTLKGGGKRKHKVHRKKTMRKRKGSRKTRRH